MSTAPNTPSSLSTPARNAARPYKIERVQTGMRLEKNILKTLKAVAELKDMSLGDLVEGIVLHAFEGKGAFSSETLEAIAQLKKIYGLELSAADAHKFSETE